MKKSKKIKWVKPHIRVIGKAKDLINESKWEGFDDGTRLNGTTPIGPST